MPRLGGFCGRPAKRVVISSQRRLANALYRHRSPKAGTTGLLKKQYEAALARAGRIWGIVSIMSLNPRAMKVSLDFYKTLMYAPLTPEPQPARKCWP